MKQSIYGPDETITLPSKMLDDTIAALKASIDHYAIILDGGIRLIEEKNGIDLYYCTLCARAAEEPDGILHADICSNRVFIDLSLSLQVGMIRLVNARASAKEKKPIADDDGSEWRGLLEL